VPAFSLDIADATELAELLRFLNDWLASDPDQLDASLRRFVDHPAYDIRALRADLDRFAFLLGDDGENLLNPPAIADTQPRPGLRSIGEANRPDHTHNRRASNPGLYFFLIGCSEVRKAGPKGPTGKILRREIVVPEVENIR